MPTHHIQFIFSLSLTLCCYFIITGGDKVTTHIYTIFILKKNDNQSTTLRNRISDY